MTPRQRQVVFWLAVLAAAIVAIDLLSAVLLPFLAGFAVAYFLDPVVRLLVRRRVPRSLATLAVLLSFLLLLALVIVLLAPLVEVQVATLAQRAPLLVDLVRDQFQQLFRFAQEKLSPDDVARLRDTAGQWATNAASWGVHLVESLLSNGFAIANVLSLIIITPVVSFFLLRDWDLLVATVDSWLPRQHVATIREQARLVDATLAGFVHGQVLVCVLLGTYYAAALSLAGLGFGLTIGLLIGILAFIPFLGVAVGFLLAVGLTALQFADWHKLLIVIVIFAVGQMVESNYLSPKLVGERVNLHPVWVIFALLAFGTLFGFVGVLLALPTAAVVGVLVRFGLGRYLDSALYDSRRLPPEG